MIITFTGKKSGKQYATPVSYFQENGSIVCFTHGHWWKNLRGRCLHYADDGVDGVAQEIYFGAGFRVKGLIDSKQSKRLSTVS
jgi:hypothetical protein